MATLYNSLEARKMVWPTMSYEAVWKTLEEIIIELRKKGVETPPNIMNDLKSAKTLMNLLATSGSDHGEAAPKIEQYLGSVEAYAITKAQKKFPTARIDTWLKRIETSSCDTCQTCQTCTVENEKTEKAETKFVTGVPRDQKWIRVNPLNSLPTEKLKQLAQETQLSFREEQSGHLIIHGNPENIKTFVKKMTQQTTKK
jgi:hypothetical protein